MKNRLTFWVIRFNVWTEMDCSLGVSQGLQMLTSWVQIYTVHLEEFNVLKMWLYTFFLVFLYHGSVSGCVLFFDFHALLCLVSVVSVFSLLFPSTLCMFVSLCLPLLYLVISHPPRYLTCPLPSSLSSPAPHPLISVCAFKPLFPIHFLSVRCVWFTMMYPVSPPVLSPLVRFGLWIFAFWFLLCWSFFVALCLAILAATLFSGPWIDFRLCSSFLYISAFCN